MFKRMIKISFIAVLLFYVFHFLFFWMFESTDSYFYWLLANFFKTGQYFIGHPYNYSVPSTMEPPLYSVFLFFAQSLPKADIIVHFIQIAVILFSGLIIYTIMKAFTGKTVSLLVATLFLLVPGHFVYVSNLVAEPIAIGFISFYLLVVYLVLEKRKKGLLTYLLPLSSVMVLQRYNLIVFWVFAFFLFLLEKKKRKEDFLGLFLSIVILTGWIFINHNLNGSWGLSNSEGKHLYNRVLHFDRILPPQNDPSFFKFKEFVGENIDYFKPWWFYELPLVASLGSETKSSQLMQEVALAALKKDPLKYLFDTPQFMVFAHASNPTFNDSLYLWQGTMKNNCRFLGTISFCRPIVKVEFSYKIWDEMVKFINWYYLNLSPVINFFLLLPALLFALFQKNPFVRFCGFLYLGSILFFVSFEAPLPRYTYLFQPLKILLIAFYVKRFSRLAFNLFFSNI